MRYIVPSSRIVFTDFMILLVSLLMALNSIMSFSQESRERNLPPVSLPEIHDTGNVGITDVKKAWVTIRSGEIGKIYFYNDREVSLWNLMEQIKKSSVPSVAVRGDRKVTFEWEEFCRLTSQLMKAGVKEISYATAETGGEKP